jgi:hypothetical protein
MLTQPQRIQISKKIIAIPDDNKVAQESQVITQVELDKAIEVDQGNKLLTDKYTPVINGYQLELQRLNGNGRTQVTEADIENGAKRTIGNYFYYNQQTVPTPSVPDGVWKAFFPFLLGYGIGKQYDETYSVVQKEQDLIDAFNSAVTAFEVFHPMERCTGQRAITVSTPPPPVDVIESYPAVQTALNNVITAVNNYNSFLTTMSSGIYLSDYDATRQSQTVTAKNNIDNIIKPAITLWTSYNNYNTSHGQSSVSGFYGYNTALLQPTKGNPVQLNALKSAITTRKTFVDTVRIPQLTSYLGNVVQNISNGEVTSKSGLYGERALALSLRINVMTGSLTKVISLQNAKTAQQAIVASNETNAEAYDLLMKVSKFKAPASNTNIIHVQDSSAFSAGNTVYVCGDGQQELTGTITAVSGSRIDLSFVVPQKYTPNNNSRLYKLV